MTKDQEDAKKTLNKDTTEINRGVELLLRRKKKPEKPKTFQAKFSFFKREIILSLDILKKLISGEVSWKRP